MGAELAAGTELEVLGAAPLLRLASRLWLVRERGTRREGYAFLEASDFAPSCPEPHLSADAATPPAPSPAAWLSARPAPTVEALLAPGGAAPERAQVVLAGDVDGDGSVDLLLEVQRSPERQLSQVGQVLARHTAAGWVGQLVSASHPDYASRWLTLALSASGAYAIEFFESQGESGFSEPAFVVHRYDAPQSALVRAGRLEADRAAHGATGVAPAWRFQATRSGGLAVTGLRGPARGFRYEAARHQLVP